MQKKKKIKHTLNIFNKINSKCIINTKFKNIKLLGDSVEKHLDDLGYGDDFYIQHQRWDPCKEEWMSWTSLSLNLLLCNRQYQQNWNISHRSEGKDTSDKPLLSKIWASQVMLVIKSLPAKPKDARDLVSIPESGTFPGQGNGNPLQYSSLENPMDRGAWPATVHEGAKSWTQLRDWAHIRNIWRPLKLNNKKINNLIKELAIVKQLFFNQN